MEESRKIYLVRHGETEYNRLGVVQGSGVDASLNETGKKQAEAFYRCYRDVPFDRVYVSGLKRTLQSVSNFLQNGRPPVERISGLNEINWGSFEGKEVYSSYNGYYENLTKQWRSGQVETPIDGGESPVDVANRQKAFIQLLHSRKEDKNVLICMHGRAMRILLCQLLGKSLHLMDDFLHSNLGLYLLTYQIGGITPLIEKTNCTQHFCKMK